VVIQVVGLDIGDHRNVGRVGQESAITLVGLGHEDLAAALVRTGPGGGEVTTDEEGRVGAAVLQRDGEHGGGRGLAGSPGDAGHPVAGH
jgi:hypothetical protein